MRRTKLRASLDGLLALLGVDKEKGLVKCALVSPVSFFQFDQSSLGPALSLLNGLLGKVGAPPLVFSKSSLLPLDQLQGPASSDIATFATTLRPLPPLLSDGMQ